MVKKKPVLQSPSSSEGSPSGEEEEEDDDDESEQGFVMSDRKSQKVQDEIVQQADEESGSEEDDEDEDDAIDGNQQGHDHPDEASEEEAPQQSRQSEGDSHSDSDTSSASEGKRRTPSHQFVVLPRRAENANGHSGKKTPTSEQYPKANVKHEASPKKGKGKESKTNTDAEVFEPEKGSSKKRKKESSDVTGKQKTTEHLAKAKEFERVSKEKGTHTDDETQKKKDPRKTAHATAIAGKAERASMGETSGRKPESSSTKKAAEKGKNDKNVVKNAVVEAVKGPLSPVKSKLFTGKDEIVLVSEILHDLQHGVEIPVKKTDGYWSELADRVQERMEGSWTKEQLCDKLKRMKTRYLSMAEKFKNEGEQKFRNTVDKELFAMWDQMWGNGDAGKVDDESDVKYKRPKVLAVASPVRQAKASRDKVIGHVEDMKVVAKESEGHEGNEEFSENAESDGGDDLDKKDAIATPMEADLKDAQVRRSSGPKTNADNALLHSVSDAERKFSKEIQTRIAEALNEWQSKVLPIAVKMVAGEARGMNALGGFDGLSMPFMSLEMRDLQLSEGDQALQQQWHELRVKELEVYCQRLELMLRECRLKQDQMKLQLHKNK